MENVVKFAYVFDSEGSGRGKKEFVREWKAGTCL